MKQLYRVYSEKGACIADLITNAGETPKDGEDFAYIAPEKPWQVRTFSNCTFRPLLQPLFRDGKLVAQLPKLVEIRQYVQQQLQNEIWTEEQRFENPHQHYLDMSVAYYQMKLDLMQSHK